MYVVATIGCAVLLAQFVVLLCVIDGFAQAREAADLRHAAEVQELLQRIQAPEQAVVTYAAKTAAPAASPPGLPYDDDQAFFASREELAAALANSDNIDS